MAFWLMCKLTVCSTQKHIWKGVIRSFIDNDFKQEFRIEKHHVTVAIVFYLSRKDKLIKPLLSLRYKQP